jgi:hypothetical protein
MAWPKRRALGFLVASGLVALFLIRWNCPAGRQCDVYDRINIGMTADEVYNVAGRKLYGQNRADFLKSVRPNSDWPITLEQWGGYGRTTEEIHISFDAKFRVADKRYESGFLLEAHRWFDDLLRRLHW